MNCFTKRGIYIVHELFLHIFALLINKCESIYTCVCFSTMCLGEEVVCFTFNVLNLVMTLQGKGIFICPMDVAQRSSSMEFKHISFRIVFGWGRNMMTNSQKTSSHSWLSYPLICYKFVISVEMWRCCLPSHCCVVNRKCVNKHIVRKPLKMSTINTERQHLPSIIICYSFVGDNQS